MKFQRNLMTFFLSEIRLSENVAYSFHCFHIELVCPSILLTILSCLDRIISYLRCLIVCTLTCELGPLIITDLLFHKRLCTVMIYNLEPPYPLVNKHTLETIIFIQLFICWFIHLFYLNMYSLFRFWPRLGQAKKKKINSSCHTLRDSWSHNVSIMRLWYPRRRHTDERTFAPSWSRKKNFIRNNDKGLTG